LVCASKAVAQTETAAVPPAPAAAPVQRINTTGRNIPLGGPLTENGFILGEVSYILTPDDSILVDMSTLLPLLQRVLAPGAWQELVAAMGSRPQVPASELAALGYPLQYDSATFGLRITVPPDRRERQTISVSGGFDPAAGVLAEPAGFSAYVTAFLNQDYVYSGANKGFATPNLILDSAVRYGGFVLENEGNWRGRFDREGTRLVYDDLRRTARYTAGDLEPVSRGFAGSTPMAGLSISRVYSDLDPQRNVQPRGQRSFTLVRPSTVETIVNGQSVQQARLGPGTYDIRDFPFAQGSNDVRLVIRDDTGAQNVISFSINFDRTLLARGLTEFGLYVGVEAPFTARGRRYTGDPVASGFFRRGLTDELTAGGNFQVTSQGAVVGGELVWAAPVGTISVNAAGSRLDGIGGGYALNIGYERVLGASGRTNRTVVATFQTTSRRFGNPGAFSINNPYSYEFGLTYSQSVGRDHYVSADAFYSIGRAAVRDQSSFRLTWGWRASRRILLTTELLYEHRPAFSALNSGFGARVALTYRFGRTSTGTAEVDTLRDRERLTYQLADGRGVGAFNISGSVDRVDGATALNASVSTTRNRAEIGLAHLTSFDPDGRITDQRTSLRAGASLAIADGHVALSRPIYDSFAIFGPHPTLGGAPVYVNPRDSDYLARSGAFGGAVAPELSAYTPQALTYDVPRAPTGYDLGNGAVQVRPPYRSGYFIQVGSDYSITYLGRLLDADGAPIGLLAGQAHEEGRPNRPPVQMFTNSAGRFAIQGLRPGRWRIEMPRENGVIVYHIDVPEGARGLVRGDDLRPETNP
jgi:outer membrane usher protein